MMADYLKIKETWDEYREATDTACKAAKAATEAQKRAAKASHALKEMIPIGHGCAIGDVVLTTVGDGTNGRVLRVLDRIEGIPFGRNDQVREGS